MQDTDILGKLGILESKVESPHKILTRDKTKSTTLQFGRKMRKHSEFSSSSDSDSDDCLFDKLGPSTSDRSKYVRRGIRNRKNSGNSNIAHTAHGNNYLQLLSLFAALLFIGLSTYTRLYGISDKLESSQKTKTITSIFIAQGFGIFFGSLIGAYAFVRLNSSGTVAVAMIASLLLNLHPYQMSFFGCFIQGFIFGLIKRGALFSCSLWPSNHRVFFFICTGMLVGALTISIIYCNDGGSVAERSHDLVHGVSKRSIDKNEIPDKDAELKSHNRTNILATNVANKANNSLLSNSTPLENLNFTENIGTTLNGKNAAMFGSKTEENMIRRKEAEERQKEQERQNEVKSEVVEKPSQLPSLTSPAATEKTTSATTIQNKTTELEKLAPNQTPKVVALKQSPSKNSSSTHDNRNIRLSTSSPPSIVNATNFDSHHTNGLKSTANTISQNKLTGNNNIVQTQCSSYSYQLIAHLLMGLCLVPTTVSFISSCISCSFKAESKLAEPPSMDTSKLNCCIILIVQIIWTGFFACLAIIESNLIFSEPILFYYNRISKLAIFTLSALILRLVFIIRPVLGVATASIHLLFGIAIATCVIVHFLLGSFPMATWHGIAVMGFFLPNMPLSIYVWLGSSTSLPQLNALTISGLFLNSFAMGHIIGPLIVNYFFPNNDESIVPAFNLVVLVINYFFFLILVKVIRKTSFKTQISILSGALNGKIKRTSDLSSSAKSNRNGKRSEGRRYEALLQDLQGVLADDDLDEADLDMEEIDLNGIVTYHSDAEIV